MVYRVHQETHLKVFEVILDPLVFQEKKVNLVYLVVLECLEKMV